jgi:hypothetical protein
LTEHIGDLVTSGKLVTISPDNPQSYREAMSQVITPQISKILQSENSGLTMIDEEIGMNWASSMLDKEILLASSNDFISKHSQFPTNEINKSRPRVISSGGISSFSVGLGGSVELLIGGVQGDAGLVFDVSGSGNSYGTRVYGTIGPSVGIELGIEGNVVFGFWTTPIQQMVDGWALGIGFEAVLYGGITAMWWFDLNNMNYLGFTLGIDGGAEIGADVIFSHTGYGPTSLNIGN